ncbi:uncharacterized protein PV09_07303 [Verruconis gallopava]|uniref:Extracellular membrane protein CFEM domain-containing protein n=1 Tax=Verruconis gallopava TaxID=253628 RepID=A0A0D2AQ18_9PEZI|nr:uncharacterized protein PV09_07303 [Verruconis gallopava]KIW01264.1 hypothetical protein PV09_07303 [Verruconis gallopava]
MKLTSAAVGLVIATSFGVAFAENVPNGAHDPRTPQPRPNVCDDKCDVEFMRQYDKCKDSDPDCVAKSRLLTCQGDFACSVNCGYTADGCVVLPSSTLLATSQTASLSNGCSGAAVSTKTKVVTISRPQLATSAILSSSLLADDTNRVVESDDDLDGFGAKVYTTQDDAFSQSFTRPSSSLTATQSPNLTMADSSSGRATASPSLYTNSSLNRPSSPLGIATHANALNKDTTSIWSSEINTASSANMDSATTRHPSFACGNITTSSNLGAPTRTQSNSGTSTSTSSAIAAMKTPGINVLGCIAAALLL